MSYEIPSDLLHLLDPSGLSSYLEVTGWTRIDGFKRAVAVYRRQEPPIAEVKVPLDMTFADFTARVEDAVRDIAEYEHRSAADVLTDIILPSDSMLFEVRGDSIRLGSMTFDKTKQILEGVRKIAMGTAIGHEDSWGSLGMLDLLRNFELLVRGGVFGKREPLLFRFESADRVDGVDLRAIFPLEGSGTLQDAPTHNSRVLDCINTQLESLSNLAGIVAEGNLDRLVSHASEDDPFDVVAPMSQRKGQAAEVLNPVLNLLDALLDIDPGDGGSLTISAVPSKLTPSTLATPDAVFIPHEIFVAGARLFEEAIDASNPRPGYYVGKVSSLAPLGRGSVELLIVDSGPTTRRVQVDLNPPDIEKAKSAHARGQSIGLQGRLYRHRPLGTIRDYAFFQVLSPIGMGEGSFSIRG